MNFDRLKKLFLDFYFEPLSDRQFRRHCILIFAVALLLRIVLALPALQDPSALLRPDSLGYWNPAAALAAGDGLVTAPGSTVPEVVRPVGYPAYLALGILLAGNSFRMAALLGIAASVLTVLPIILTTECAVSRRAGLLAGWLYALNITAIAAAPMILSDTLLGFICAWQFYAAIKFIRQRRLHFFALLVLMVMLGMLVKPVNLLIVLGGLPLILCLGAASLKEFGKGLLLWAVLFSAILLPYWVRNWQLCGDIDGNSANLYFHNGSAIMAHATGESSEVWRQRLLDSAEYEFAENPRKYPTLREQNRYKKQQFRAMIKKYPYDTFITHLPNIYNLLPDVPSLLENNLVTQSGRGTMAVLRKDGFFAAVNHYFNGKSYILLLLIPLLMVHLFILLSALRQLVGYFCRGNWRMLLIFAVLAFYYIWAPGPVISPRYLLPALPCLIFMAVQPWNKSDENSINI